MPNKFFPPQVVFGQGFITEIEREVEQLSSGDGTTNIVMIPQQLWLSARGLHKTAYVKHGQALPLLSLLNYWLMMNSGGGAVIDFSCVPTAEPTRLQWIVLNPMVLA